MLILCEKPSVAADVSRALGTNTEQFRKTSWGYESPRWLVTAAVGHLVSELPPEKYDATYKTWSYEHLPIIPTKFLYQPKNADAAKRLKTVAELMRREDVTTIINACDAGREGELIFKLIYQYARLTPQKTVLRAWFASMTTQAIQTAFNNLKPDVELLPLETAARCRAEADWLVGMNATRAATTTLGGQRVLLSLGRVQTPTLALVVTRDLEIETFQPENYWKLKATFTHRNGTYEGYWFNPTKNPQNKFDKETDATQTLEKLRQYKNGAIETVETKPETINPPKLFDLTELQRAANKKHGLSAAQTLKAAQSCYEKHKVLSYPRTDSSYITSDMAPVIPSLLNHVANSDPDLYRPLVELVTNQNELPIQTLVADHKVTDHHALLPTDTNHDLTKLSTPERQIYDLVAHRLIAALLPAQKKLRTTIITTLTPELDDRFKTTGTQIIVNGWKDVEPDTKTTPTSDEDQTELLLPQLQKGEPVDVSEMVSTKHVTSAPKHFTEAALLAAMVGAGKLVEDIELSDAMKGTGLGTPATRAATIETLLGREYLTREKRILKATSKGRGLILALGNNPLVLPDLTGQWEQRLAQLEKTAPNEALETGQQFLVDVKQFTKEITDSFKNASPDQLRAGRRVLTTCPVPQCAGSIVETAKAYACDSWQNQENPGCGFVFWKKQNNKTVGETQLYKYVADVTNGKIVVEPPPDPTPLGECPSPNCQGQIKERAKTFGCTSYRSPKEPGCGYLLWKTNPDGTPLDRAGATELIATGQTNSKPKPLAFRACPRCDGTIRERDKAWSCDSYKSPKHQGCRSTVWKTRRDGTTVTPQEAHELFEAMVGTPSPQPFKRKTRSPRKPSK